MNEKSDRYIYLFSHELNQEIALSKNTGKVYCKDKTVYQPEEIEILNQAGGLQLGIHLLKKIFSGKIIKQIGKPKCIAEQSKNISETEKNSKNKSTQKQTEYYVKKSSDSQELEIF